MYDRFDFAGGKWIKPHYVTSSTLKPTIKNFNFDVNVFHTEQVKSLQILTSIVHVYVAELWKGAECEANLYILYNLSYFSV